MEIGTKQQLDFFKGYPMLVVLVGMAIAIVYLYNHGNVQYEARIRAEQEKNRILEDAVKDYRQNTLISNQLNAASKALTK